MKRGRFSPKPGEIGSDLGVCAILPAPIRLNRGLFPVQCRPGGLNCPRRLRRLFGGIRQAICDTSSQRLPGIPQLVYYISRHCNP